MQRVGPDEFTLSAIAAEAGVTPAALVQRFGSRHALLVKLAAAAAAAAPDMGALLLAEHRSPVVALREFAACFAAMAHTPDAMARSLAYLHNDISDPELRTHLMAQARGSQRSIAKLVELGRDDAELVKGADVDAIVQALQSMISGSLMSWAIMRKGPALDWLRRDFMTLLGPYLTPLGKRRLRSR